MHWAAILLPLATFGLQVQKANRAASEKAERVAASATSVEPESMLLNVTMVALILIVIALVWVIDDAEDAIALATFAVLAPKLHGYFVSRRNRPPR